MIKQGIKDAYYSVLRPASFLLKPVYSLKFSRRPKPLRVHVGCGKNYLNGFINIDGNAMRKVDCVLDVRVGLPFADDSVSFIYSCHMLEHLQIYDAMKVLREWKRVLEPGGHARLTLPDFTHVFQIMAGEAACDFPRPFRSREGQAINFLFCDSQHKYGYSFDLVKELAADLGFDRVERADVGYDPLLGSIDEPGGSFVANLYK